MYYKSRRDSRAHASPERRPSGKSRLPRQSTAIDESPYVTSGGSGPSSRRGSQPTLSPDPAALTGSSPDEGGRKARRDSLSPDSASLPRGRRDSRSLDQYLSISIY